MFIVAFTTACHFSLPCGYSIHSTSFYLIIWRSILTSSSHLRLALPSCFLPSCFPITPLYATLPMRATCPAPFIVQFFTQIIFGEEYRSQRSSLCSLLHSRYLVPLSPKLSCYTRHHIPSNLKTIVTMEQCTVWMKRNVHT